MFRFCKKISKQVYKLDNWEKCSFMENNQNLQNKGKNKHTKKTRMKQGIRKVSVNSFEFQLETQI